MRNVDSEQWSMVSGQCETASGLFHPSFLIPHPSSFPIPHPLSPIPSRRGVLLLLVLGLLALFGLVAVAFVVVTGHAQRSSKTMQRIDQTLEQPEKILNEAMMQIARGPSNPVSVLGPHSLLEDMYGNTSVYGHITGATASAGNQLIEITYALANPNIMYPNGTPQWVADTSPQLRPGCVVTFLDSSLMGESTRIVGTNPTSGNLQLLAAGPISASAIPLNTRIVINSTPFSGTGFGYNPTSTQLDLAYDTTTGLLTTTPNPPTTRPVALLPNLPLSLYTSLIPLSGANEDYDAADYQNMALGAQIANAGGNVTGVIPSMHRPALVNYWFNQLFTSSTMTTAIPDPVLRWNAIIQPYGPDYIQGNADDNCDAATASYILNLKRRILLRPLPEDNPDFNGSNPTSKYFNYTSSTNPPYYWERDINTVTNPMNYRLDVDNDGDGVADSIWVDLGMPVRATKDGKLYKPLFAILCVDMDGRLNLNAHGTRDQAQAAYYQLPTPPSGTSFANGLSAANSHRGLGYGPADVNLGIGLNLSASDYGTLLSNRYSQSGVPGDSGADPLSMNKWFNYGINNGSDYWNFSNVDNAGVYGSRPIRSAQAS
jgi:hypothetical protein